MATTPSSIRVGTRYRFSRIDRDYDAIVIGSGIGGLTSAACLAKMGKKFVYWSSTTLQADLLTAMSGT